MLPSAMLSDICDHPNDLAVRLIAADWLDEHGAPGRAEFIRTQIKLGQDYKCYCPVQSARARTGDCQPCQLRQRCSQLLKEHDQGYYWSGYNTTSCLNWRRQGYLFNNGFVERLICFESAWIVYGPWVVRECPLQRVVLRDLQPEVLSGLNNRLHYLYRSNRLPDYWWRLLVAGKESGDGWIEYANALDALDDMSRVVLTWAREKARQVVGPV